VNDGFGAPLMLTAHQLPTLFAFVVCRRVIDNN
jgi:hypothetical protein